MGCVAWTKKSLLIPERICKAYLKIDEIVLRWSLKQVLNLGASMLQSNVNQAEFCPSLNEADRKLILEEAKVLDQVLLALAKEKAEVMANRRSLAKRMENLKDEAVGINEEDLPALFDQLHNQWSLVEGLKGSALPNPQTPYFARIALVETHTKPINHLAEDNELEEQPDEGFQERRESKLRNILIGYMTFLSKYCEWPIIDWRNSPSAKVFFNCSESEPYLQALPQRFSKGYVAERRVLVIHQGVLQSISNPEAKYMRSKEGIWQKSVGWQDVLELSGGAGSATRSHRFGTGQSNLLKEDIRGLLDKDQYEILNADSDDSLLVLGSAGSGKTTVALQRLSLLYFQHPERFNLHTMMILVPDIGLMRLSKNLLRNHDLSELPVLTFDLWMAKEGRRLLRSLPKKIYQDTPGSVVRIKRDQRFLHCLHLYVEKQRRTLLDIWGQAFKRIPDDFLASFLLGVAENDQGYSENRSLLSMCQLLEEFVRANLVKSVSAKKKLDATMRRSQGIIHDLAADREAILTDRALLSHLLDHDITVQNIEEFVKHARSQLFADIDVQGGGYDLSRRIAVDGRDEGDIAATDTPYKSIDIEDYPLFFYLQVLKQGHTSLGRPKGGAGIEHLVLDEAQELVPIELKVISLALAPSASVTIAGDAVQQTREIGGFDDWEMILSRLGLEGVKRERLTTNYRSTKPIVDFAAHVLGKMAPEVQGKTIKDGAPIRLDVYGNYGECLISISDELRALMSREENASVAIVLSSKKAAEQFFAELRHLDKARLVLDGHFSFTPGIDVTAVDQVKGLEFDYVVIPDCNQSQYPDTPGSRRKLHVASTRAIHQLWLTSTGKLSSLVPENLDSKKDA